MLDHLLKLRLFVRDYISTKRDLHLQKFNNPRYLPLQSFIEYGLSIGGSDPIGYHAHSPTTAAEIRLALQLHEVSVVNRVVLLKCNFFARSTQTSKSICSAPIASSLDLLDCLLRNRSVPIC